MIITCKKEIPFRWILFAILPWASIGYTWSISGAVFIFSLKKFVENPAGLTFILSLPGFISLLVAPFVSFVSDRIWTRYGRRKPFITGAWIGIAVTLALMPLMPNFWSLLAVFILYNFVVDFNSPLEPLKQEIIPPHERGRATGTMQWCMNLAGILFAIIAFGRFDDVRFMAGVPIIGESALYWSASLLILVMLLLIMLGIKEIDQKSPLRGERLSIRNYLGGLLDRELWPVYILVFGSAVLGAGLGPLGNLLYTDQWGYSKQEMGINTAVGGVINFFIIGFLVLIADKLNRMRAYLTLICVSVGMNIAYFIYVTYILPDQRPSLVEIIVFGESGSIIGMLTGMVYIPMVYDYIRRNKMGTYAAGAGIVTKITSLVTLNGVGIFIWAYTALFQPPAGEMTRVVLQGGVHSKSEVSAILQPAKWTAPENGAPVASSNIDVNAWQSNGTISDTGLCWEMRMRDHDSDTLANQKLELNKELSLLISDEKSLTDKVVILTRKGNTSAAAKAQQSALEIKSQMDALTVRIEKIDSVLDARAANFKQQVLAVVGDRLLVDGQQVLAANLQEAIVIEWPIQHRPHIQALEKTLDELRVDFPAIIDLRPIKRDVGYGLAISAVIDRGADEAAIVRDIQSALEKRLPRHEKNLLKPGTVPASKTREAAVTMDLLVIEEPLETYISPITRVVNLVLEQFGQKHNPARKLAATARSLRAPEGINHIRINPGTAPHSFSVTGVLPKSAPKSVTLDDAVGRRLQALLGATTTPDLLLQSNAFYDRIEKTAASQRLTVARPVIAAAYAPTRYNYMCGYIWMIALGLVGISIVLFFIRFEAQGFIHKRGAEEAAAS